MKHHQRAFEIILASRLKENPRFIHLVMGPRQVGKTTGVQAVLEKRFSGRYLYHECEDAIHTSDWFLTQVQRAEEQKIKILVFDEIQKIDGWSELVKLAWDKQKRLKKQMHWILLGSSSLKLTQGVNESLAGRFEIIPVRHWGFLESKAAFGLNFEQFLNYGGYPASYALLKEPERLRRYLMDSVFDSVVNRDIFRFVTIKKPALFRQTFYLACQYPAQEMSYNKFLGQLQEAGNVDQIKHYLELCAQAYLIRLVFKYTHKRSRTSSPKLIPSAPAFTRLFLNRELTPEEQGFVFEAVVGKCLIDSFEEVFYWRDGNKEIDYVVIVEGCPIGIEIKSKKRVASGIGFFRERFKKAKTIVIDFVNYPDFEKDPKSFLLEFSV